MKKLNTCKDENCIPTPSSCVTWNGGTIEYLGICDGDQLNNLLWEVITKLQEVAGEDLSSFDIDSLLDICNQKAPSEVTLLSILNTIKNNQICLKDFIDNLNERLGELFGESGVNVNLKCYAEFDNLGNSLSITRDQLDQLIIDNLCNHKGRIETLEGKVTSLQSQIDNVSATSTVDELDFSTCIDPVVKPTSSQVISIANELCDLEEATGNSSDISSALANTPTYPTEVTSNINYINSPQNWAENYNNLLLFIDFLSDRLNDLSACCGANCDSIKLGFSAVYNEDGSGIIIRFSWGAGTSIPTTFEDCGSTGVITDVDGNTVSFNIEIGNDSEDEVSIVGLNTLSPLTVEISAKLCSDSITCQKCISRTVKAVQCQYCTFTATGTTGSAVIVYEINVEEPET